MEDRHACSLSDALRVLSKDRTEERAWKCLYQTLWPFVVAQNYRYLRGLREAAEDASQEVFLRLVRYTNFRTLRNPTIFRAYLKSVCANVCRTYIEQARRKGISSSEVGLDDHEVGELRSREFSPEAAAEASEILQAVVRPLGDIEETILTKVIEGYSLQEIADLCGLSYSATAVRLHRIRKQLADQLSPTDT